MDYMLGIAFLAFSFWFVRLVSRRVNKEVAPRTNKKKQKGSHWIQQAEREVKQTKDELKRKEEEKLDYDDGNLDVNDNMITIKNHDGSTSMYQRPKIVVETPGFKWLKEKLYSYNDRGLTWEDCIKKMHSGRKTDAKPEWWVLLLDRNHFGEVTQNIIFDTWDEVVAFKAWMANEGPPYQKWKVYP